MGESKRFIFPACVALLVHALLAAFTLPFHHAAVSGQPGEAVRIEIGSPVPTHPALEKQVITEEKEDPFEENIPPPPAEDVAEPESVPIIDQKERRIVMEQAPQKEKEEEDRRREKRTPPEQVKNTHQEPESSEDVQAPAAMESKEKITEENGLLEVGDQAELNGEAMPMYLRNRQPEYPELARRRGLSGKVLLHVLVDQAGSVVEVEIKRSSGHRSLDMSALRSVRQWQFVPGRRNGHPVTMWVDVPVRFQLKR